MLIFNFNGLLAVVVSGLVVWYPYVLLEKAYPKGAVGFISFTLLVLVASILGFTFDRFHTDRFIESYKNGISNIFDNKRPGERVLMFISPLAPGSLVLFTGITIFWLVELFTGNKNARNDEILVYWGISAIAALISLIYGYLTRSHRNLNKR